MDNEMKWRLILGEHRTPEFQHYDEPLLKTGCVRVLTRFGAPKHGTELTEIAEDPFNSDYYDETEHIFKKRPAPREMKTLGLGNMWVGEITEVAPDVTAVQVGQKVAGYGALQHTHTVPADRVLPMPLDMDWKTAVCFDPLQFALGGIRDSHFRIGDTVLISGQGAIGLMAAQCARLAGASLVVVADPIEKRREVGLKNGADYAFDPREVDVGLQLRMMTGGRGVDIVIETSGNYHAVEEGLRALTYQGTLACVGWFKHQKVELNFGREGHFNQQRIIFSRACSEPNNDYPGWDFKRIKAVAWDMLVKGRFTCDAIVDPVVPFSRAAEAYTDYVIKGSPNSVKLGVSFQ
ncbi:MAG: zinc-binding alcohol dehydrogenase [Sphaerochaetaceae bacterium]|nr:zinc-binding alcohol dehydrogenase [Sphaerochaetaceae bacterium]